ncbi:15803_t:CDS:2, partial [Gigaspora rosea]
INETNEEACLKVINDSSQSQYLFLPEGEILIGIKNSNYIIIKDQEINKKQAKINYIIIKDQEINKKQAKIKNYQEKLISSAYEIAEKARSSVETYPFIFKEKKLPSITLSIGTPGMNSSLSGKQKIWSQSNNNMENEQISIRMLHVTVTQSQQNPEKELADQGSRT